MTGMRGSSMTGMKVSYMTGKRVSSMTGMRVSRQQTGMRDVLQFYGRVYHLR